MIAGGGRRIRASAEQRWRFGSAPNARNASRQASRCGWSSGATEGAANDEVAAFTSPEAATTPARYPGNAARTSGETVERDQSASCWYAIDWNDMRCSGETPSFSIAARCSGVE